MHSLLPVAERRSKVIFINLMSPYLQLSISFLLKKLLMRLSWNQRLTKTVRTELAVFFENAGGK